MSFCAAKTCFRNKPNTFCIMWGLHSAQTLYLLLLQGFAIVVPYTQLLVNPPAMPTHLRRSKRGAPYMDSHIWSPYIWSPYSWSPISGAPDMEHHIWRPYIYGAPYLEPYWSPYIELLHGTPYMDSLQRAYIQNHYNEPLYVAL